jgi:transposase InsO family protein
MLSEVGIQSVKLPPRSPNLNAYAERFVRTIKESCLDLLILFGGGRVAEGDSGVRGTLPSGTESPRARQPVLRRNWIRTRIGSGDYLIGQIFTLMHTSSMPVE